MSDPPEFSDPNRRNSYVADGVVFYHASALSRCPRALWLDRMEERRSAPPAKMAQRWRDGWYHEVEVIERLLGLGFELEAHIRSDGQWTIQWPLGNYGPDQAPVVVTGTPDFWTPDPDQIIRWLKKQWDGVRGKILQVNGVAWGDVKSMAPAGYQKFLADPFAYFEDLGYDHQFTAYLMAAERPGLILAKDKGSGALAGVVIDEPLVDPSEVKAKTLRIELACKTMVAPDCQVPLDFPCPFFTHHDAPPDPATPEAKTSQGVTRVAQSTRESVLELGRQLSRAQEAEAAAKAEVKEIKERISKAMGRSDEVATENERVYRRTGRSPGRIDAKLLEVEQPEIHKKYWRQGKRWETWAYKALD